MPSPTLKSLVPALLSVGLAACGASERAVEGAWNGTIDTLASGIVVVRNDGRPTWTPATAWRLTEELRIGSMMEAGPTAFGQVRDLLVDDDGRIYVLDSQAQEVRVFGPDGGHLRTIGRKGEGPGELKDAVAMGWAPGGLLRVVDLGNARISSFTREGEFVDGLRQTGGFAIYPWPGVFFPDGGLVAVSPGMGEDGFEPLLIRYGPDLAPSDTARMPTYSGEEAVFELVSGEGSIMASVPYAAGLTWDLDEQGFVWVASNTAEYRIDRLSLAGDTVLRIEKPYEPVPVSRAEIDSAVAAMTWFTDQGGRIDRSKFPATKAALSRIVVLSDGHVLVAPTTSEFGSGWGTPPSVVDVFEPSGRYLGRLDLPTGFQLTNPTPRVVDGRLYGVARDELDVPFVARYRLDTPGS